MCFQGGQQQTSTIIAKMDAGGGEQDGVAGVNHCMVPE